MLTYFGIQRPVEEEVQDEEEIAGSWPLFGSFLGCGNM
jgi:hypothetical protein